MPEVKDVLEKHLNPEKDFSLAIRSFYGQMFPWLVQIDESWATQHIDKIFPRDPDYSTYRDTAWESFIMFNKPHFQSQTYQGTISVENGLATIGIKKCGYALR